MAIFLFSDRSFERNRLPRNLEDLPHLIERQVHPLRDFFRGRFTPEFLYEMSRGPDELIDCLYHVHRNTDRPGLIGDRSSNGLPNPPRGVRAELIPALVLELIHGLHQADVSLLNQIQELKPAVRILLGDADDKSQIRLNQFGLSPLDLLLRYVEMFNGIFDLIGGHQCLFGFQLLDAGLGRLKDFFDIVESVLRTARLALDGEKTLTVPAQLPKGVSTSFTANPEATLTTDDLPFRRSDLDR